MAGVKNNSERQYNLRHMDPKTNVRTLVRLAPGFNVVDDDHWKVIKQMPFVKELHKKGVIEFGDKIDDLELEQDPDTKTKSKSEKVKNGKVQGKGKTKS